MRGWLTLDARNAVKGQVSQPRQPLQDWAVATTREGPVTQGRAPEAGWAWTGHRGLCGPTFRNQEKCFGKGTQVSVILENLEHPAYENRAARGHGRRPHHSQGHPPGLGSRSAPSLLLHWHRWQATDRTRDKEESSQQDTGAATKRRRDGPGPGSLCTPQPPGD